MINNWKKFNEEIAFFKKDKEESKYAKGPVVMSSTGRPSDEEVQRIRKDVEKLKSPIDFKIDSDFLQDVSDRLYGPDSEDYVRALKELNKDFRPRTGRYGSQFYDPSEQEKVKRREQSIINALKEDR